MQQRLQLRPDFVKRAAAGLQLAHGHRQITGITSTARHRDPRSGSGPLRRSSGGNAPQAMPGPLRISRWADGTDGLQRPLRSAEIGHLVLLDTLLAVRRRNKL